MRLAQTNWVDFYSLGVRGQFEALKKLFLVRIPSVDTHLVFLPDALEAGFGLIRPSPGDFAGLVEFDIFFKKGKFSVVNRF